MQELAVAALIGAMSVASVGCGEIAPSTEEAGAPTIGTTTTGDGCVQTHCTELVGRPEPHHDVFDASADFCGQTPTGNIEAGTFVYYGLDEGSSGDCECSRGDGGIVAECKVVTLADCQARASCGECTAGLSCRWCKGSDDDPTPRCVQSPAIFSCDRSGHVNIANAKCSP